MDSSGQFLRNESFPGRRPAYTDFKSSRLAPDGSEDPSGFYGMGVLAL